MLAGNWSFVLLGPIKAAIAPLWSVSVEEQFYLFWPPIVARLSRRRIGITSLIMIGIAERPPGWSRICATISSQRLWFNTFAHLDSLALGILIAVLLHGWSPALGGLSRVALALVRIHPVRGSWITRP